MWQVVLSLACALLLVLSFKLITIIYRPYRASPLHKLPGPPNGHFILGNLLEIMKKPPMVQSLDWAKEYNAPLVHFRFLWNVDFVLVLEPSLVQVVLNNPNIYTKNNLPGYELMEKFFGKGLITLHGKEHSNHRKLITPAFKHGSIKNLIRVFSNQTDVLLNQLKNSVGKTVCVNELMNKVTLNIIGLAGFGFDFTAFNPDRDTLGNRTFTAFSELIHKHDILNAFVPGMKFIPTPSNISAFKNLRFLNRVVLELVQSKRTSLNKRENKPVDILDLLIAARDEETGFQLTDAELSAHVKTFLGAGHETTSMMLTWTLYLLSQHPNVIEKIRQEIHEVVGDSDDFTILNLEKLVYMGFVFKEVLRLYPPAAVVGRNTSCDTKLGSAEIPKGTTISISPMILGRISSVWDKPDEFIPERWEKETDFHPFQNIPFLRGPRNCIGQKFALLEAKVILTKTLRKFTFEMTKEEFSKVETALHITLRPKNDLMMKLIPAK